MPALNKDLPVPLYFQLQQVLKAEIEAGRWRPDEKLPSEAELARLYGVSMITLREALSGLAELEYIRREHGRGTFVASRRFDEVPRELTSFTEEMRRKGIKPTSRIIDCSRSLVKSTIAEMLRISRRSQVHTLKRLRFADGEPVSLQTAYIPASMVPGLELTENDSLYQVLQNRYHLYAAKAREIYKAGLATAEAGKILRIDAGSPVFLASRTTFLPNETPFEFVESVVRADRYSIVLELIRGEKKNQSTSPLGLHNPPGG